MRPSRHLTSSALLSLMLAPWIAWRALFVLAGGVLLDIDRYVWFAVRYRTLHPGEAMKRFQGRDRVRGGPRILHSVEFLVLLAILGFVQRLAWWFALGVAFHLLLDLFVHKSRGRFWFYFDPSSLHCLTFDWAERRGDKAAVGPEEPQQPQDET